MIKNEPHPKTIMLFNEWKELFRLAHDDVSKQQAILDRKKALKELLQEDFTNSDDEYLALFALQTAYALIVKIVAFKVISKIRYNADLINFDTLSTSDSSVLRIQMARLEDGAIFRAYKLTNLLEGDFFSWYSSENQWNDRIASCVREVFRTLSRYSDKAVMNLPEKSQDFFKALYIEMIPEAVRHSLGEYYTKKWLAQNVVEEAVQICGVEHWRGLDPCCGSGTFLTVMIEMVLNNVSEKSSEEQLIEVLNRVKGVDLNPVAVLTARVNYFLNIAHLLKDDTVLEIPVFLGDASYAPQHEIF